MPTAARLLFVACALLAFRSPAFGRDRHPLPEAIIRPQFAGTLTPDHALEFWGFSTTKAPAGYRIWKLSDEIAGEIVPSRGLLPSQLPRATVASGVPKELAPFRYQLIPLPPGTYIAQISAAQTASRYLWFNVSTIGLVSVWTTAGDEVTAFDLRTARVRKDVTFSSSLIPHAVQRADDAGHAILAGGTILGRADDGSLAGLLDGSGDAGTENRKFVVTTDRPIYRPGDTIELRLIMRDADAAAFAVPSGNLALQLLAPHGGASVWTESPTISRFGTVSARIRLPSDAELGAYQLKSGERALSEIHVAAYRKPEFTVAVNGPKHVVSGGIIRLGADVRYLFGRPAAGTIVNASAGYRTLGTRPFRYGIRTTDDANVANLPRAQVTTKTDRNGQASLALRAPSVTWPTAASVTVDARDASGKTVTSQTELLVSPSDIDLSLRSERFFSALGAPETLTLQARDYDAHPRAGLAITVHAVRRIWGPSGGVDDSVIDKRAVTGPDGAASLVVTPAVSGYYEISASASDSGGRIAHASTQLWVSGSATPPYTFDTLTVTPERSVLAPGDPVALLVTSPIPNADVLIVTSSRSSGPADAVLVQHLAGTSGIVHIAAPTGVSNFTVSVSIVGQGNLTTNQTQINIAPQPHRLTIDVTPDRATYRPGDMAHVALHAQDDAGLPARAELSLAVVDDGIFALAGSDASDPYNVLYGPSRATFVASSWWSLNQAASFPLMRIGAATRFRAAAATPGITYDDAVTTLGLSSDDARTDFRDTAYWTPSIITDAHGDAEVTFRWPDSLTSFTARAIGVTVTSDIGSGSGRALVTKPYLVRLETPRFIRSGDAATITTIAHGERSAKITAFRLRAPALGVDDRTRIARYDATAAAALPWTVYGGSAIGSARIELAGASGGLHDALRVALPVEAAVSASHERAAGVLPNDPRLVLTLPPSANAGDLKIKLSPSLVATLADSVRLLDVYPYYCVEQTMSAALPAVALERAHSGTSTAAGLDPATVATHAIKRLVQLQHADGAWGWWEHDESNPFMTAYALYGLAELARDGYAVPEQTLERGVKAVNAEYAMSTTLTISHAATGNVWNTRAYLLFALANARPSALDLEKLHEVDAHVGEMNDYGLAVLGLAHVGVDDTAGAENVLDALLLRAHERNGMVWWTDGGWHYGWVDDPVEATAYALRLLHAVRPADPRTAGTLVWLQQQQRGAWFGTTKDTAASILTMINIVAPSELHPDETVTVALNGKRLRSVHVTATVLAQTDASISVPAAALRHGGVLTFSRTGVGSLYWSTDWARFGDPRKQIVTDMDPSQMQTLGTDDSDPFTIERTYKASHAGPWRVGDEIAVDVTIRTSRDSEFIAIEDPLPAGVEYQPAQGQVEKYQWSGLQFFDDRVVFFAQRLLPQYPLKLQYTMRVTTAGRFTAPAPSAYAMYGPPVTAFGKSERITIVSGGGAP